MSSWSRLEATSDDWLYTTLLSNVEGPVVQGRVARLIHTITLSFQEQLGGCLRAYILLKQEFVGLNPSLYQRPRARASSTIHDKSLCNNKTL